LPLGGDKWSQGPLQRVFQASIGQPGADRAQVALQVFELGPEHPLVILWQVAPGLAGHDDNDHMATATRNRTGHPWKALYLARLEDTDLVPVARTVYEYLRRPPSHAEIVAARRAARELAGRRTRQRLEIRAIWQWSCSGCRGMWGHLDSDGIWQSDQPPGDHQDAARRPCEGRPVKVLVVTTGLSADVRSPR
jgi:hypothetical protein